MKIFAMLVTSLLVSCTPEPIDTAPRVNENFQIPEIVPQNPTPEPAQEVNAWIPRAEKGEPGGVHFEGEQLEMLPWGPKTFHIDTDGTFWIADTVVEQVLHTRRDGSIIEVFDLSDTSVGVTMVDVNEQELVVVSAASMPPRAQRFARSGELLAEYDMPLDWRGSLTGIALADNGQVIVEREEGYRRYTVQENEDGHELVPARSLTWDLATPSEFDHLMISPVDARNEITLRRFIGTRDNATYVYAEEWRQDEYARAVVDSTIRMFNDAGEQISLARVNIRERYTFVDIGGVQFDQKSGDMLVMMTKQNGLSIVPLDFVEQLDPLADWGKPEGWVPEDKFPNTSLVCWSYMDSVIGVMLNPANGGLGVHANSPSCTGRTIPSIVMADNFFGVPYSWGDCDNLADFDWYMDQANGSNYKAGDADGTLTSPSSCSRGTDCSGLITRAWGYSCPGGKLSTTSIASSTYTNIDTGSWNPGEVYNLAGSHVVMYYGLQSGNNYYWYESTVDLNYDSVVKSTHPMSYYSGYTHRRFVNQC